MRKRIESTRVSAHLPPPSREIPPLATREKFERERECVKLHPRSLNSLMELNRHLLRERMRPVKQHAEGPSKRETTCVVPLQIKSGFGWLRITRL